jgi:hypothetical protein
VGRYQQLLVYLRLLTVSQPRQSWERYGTSLQTKAPFELVDTDTVIVPFPLQ